MAISTLKVSTLLLLQERSGPKRSVQLGYYIGQSLVDRLYDQRQFGDQLG